MSLPVYACPFCGGGGRLGILQVGPAFALSCGSCGSAGPMAGGPELAIQLWNRAERLKPDPVPAAAFIAPPPPQPAQVPPPAAKKGTKVATSFCGADTLLSEPDGRISVRRGPGCTCPKEGA